MERKRPANVTLGSPKSGASRSLRREAGRAARARVSPGVGGKVGNTGPRHPRARRRDSASLLVGQCLWSCAHAGAGNGPAHAPRQTRRRLPHAPPRRPGGRRPLCSCQFARGERGRGGLSLLGDEDAIVVMVPVDRHSDMKSDVKPVVRQRSAPGRPPAVHGCHAGGRGHGLWPRPRVPRG